MVQPGGPDGVARQAAPFVQAASGPVVEPFADAETAELAAVLFFLRHVDPAGYQTAVYVTDYRPISDFWQAVGVDRTSDPLSKNRGRWLQVAALRAELALAVRIRWQPRQSTAGSRWADKLAKAAATASGPASAWATAVQRTSALTRQLGVFYGRMLEVDVQAETMLEADAVPRKGPRPPSIPRHLIADDRNLLPRCVRCLMPAPMLAGGSRACRPPTELGHRTTAIGEAVFCR